MRRTLNKVFPDHWSFLLGEIALYSFIVLLLSGTYLTFFFDAVDGARSSTTARYAPLRGITMSRAYDSTLRLSFDVRGGLFMRQMHHWAALLFMASIVVHMLRVFFTGAFRRPRETNWLIGVMLFILGIAEGFAGYSMPDDLLSGTGLRIMASIILTIPVVGTWVVLRVFGGDYPGTQIIGRLYIVHVLLVPGDHPRADRRAPADPGQAEAHPVPRPGADRAQRGRPPAASRRSRPRPAAFFIWCSACCALLGGLVQINPVWLWGPYNPAQVAPARSRTGTSGFLDGSTRLLPAWDIALPGVHRSRRCSGRRWSCRASSSR